MGDDGDGLWSFIAGIPREIYTANAGDVYFGAHTTHLVRRAGLVSRAIW